MLTVSPNLFMEEKLNLEPELTLLLTIIEQNHCFGGNF